ncbi:MAG TPA: hypothetical protein VK486_10930 [Thermoleophilaceae bacterium]|nr:hypothetical protein [Thermoleophilaceae bacterium]
MKRSPALPLLLLAVAIAGCGSSDAAPAVDESDLPGSTVACLDAQGVAAHLEGTDEKEVVLDVGARVKFYLTAAAAEAAQFQGEGEGAEQIGSALLFIDPELDQKTEDAVKVAEGCLADL